MIQREALRHEGVMPGNDHEEREKEKECRGPWWRKKERKEGNGGTNEQK